MEKKLKATKQRLTLLDGRELQYHVPRIPTEDLSDLRSQLPPWDGPLELEVGCGKGEFLAARAALMPETFFIGIDRRHDRIHLTDKKLRRLDGGKNWLLLEADARQFLMDDLPLLERLHVYHPDPWPKFRHHKNRFFRSPAAKIWTQKIRSGGELRFSTDHREYFEEVLDIVQSWPHLRCEWVYKKQSFHGAPLTHFEKIFLSKNEPVFKALFVKVS